MPKMPHFPPEATTRALHGRAAPPRMSSNVSDVQWHALHGLLQVNSTAHHHTCPLPTHGVPWPKMLCACLSIGVHMSCSHTCACPKGSGACATAVFALAAPPQRCRPACRPLSPSPDPVLPSSTVAESRAAWAPATTPHSTLPHKLCPPTSMNSKTAAQCCSHHPSPITHNHRCPLVPLLLHALRFGSAGQHTSGKSRTCRAYSQLAAFAQSPS